MNLDHLRTFVTIVDAGGVGRGAARLHTTQPTASRQVSALEADLGVKLFDRIGRRVQLTSPGEDLLRRGRSLLAQAESFRERARALEGGRAGSLRFGATPQFIESVLVAFVPQFQRRHPGVEVEIVEDGGARMPGRLERGEVHLARLPVGDGRFPGRLLFPNHVLAVLPAAHHLRRRAVVEVADLADERTMVLGPGFASREWFQAACQVAHVRPRVVLESVAPQTLIAAARASYGVALLPCPVSIDRRGVRVKPLVHRNQPIGRWSMIAWHPQRFLAPYAEPFVDELVAYCRRHHPNRDVLRRAAPMPPPKEPAMA
jgi:DNA-binding transcriptional LysR family regulator